MDFDVKKLVNINLNNFGLQSDNLFIYQDNFNNKYLSGNKLRKIFGNINNCSHKGLDTIITIGGNYSNYLYSMSFVPKLYNINVIAIIKGTEPLNYGFTLETLKNNNIKMIFIERNISKNDFDTLLLDLSLKYPKSIFLPEGGTNEYSSQGFKSLISKEMLQFDIITCGIGSGGTLHGLSSYFKKNIIAFCPILDKEIETKYKTDIIDINFDYCLNGFGKYDEKLLFFVLEFWNYYKILLDPIYTSKMMYGLIDMYKKNILYTNSKICAIHTGGLQGWFGFVDRYKNRKYILDIVKILDHNNSMLYDF